MYYASVITEDDCSALPALRQVLAKPETHASKKMQISEERKHKNLQIEYNAVHELTQVSTLILLPTNHNIILHY